MKWCSDAFSSSQVREKVRINFWFKIFTKSLKLNVNIFSIFLSLSSCNKRNVLAMIFIYACKIPKYETIHRKMLLSRVEWDRLSKQQPNWILKPLPRHLHTADIFRRLEKFIFYFYGESAFRNRKMRAHIWEWRDMCVANTMRSPIRGPGRRRPESHISSNFTYQKCFY